MPYIARKILRFCMMLDGNVLNNFHNCSDFRFQTDLMLNILEQIEYLNLL
jgi:hypothetical protein